MRTFFTGAWPSG